MNGLEILSSFQEQLQFEMEHFAAPKFEPAPWDMWLAMSVFQKAIRRADLDFALRASATLLETAPKRFWRRCTVIAIEDVGIANLEVVGLVISAIARTGSGRSSSQVDNWKLASYLTTCLVESEKCRACDDLAMIAEHHPAFAEERRLAFLKSEGDLISQAIQSELVPFRGLAAWYLIGTARCPSPELIRRIGYPNGFFDALAETHIPLSVVEICREGFRQSHEVICSFLPLLAAIKPREPRRIADDDVPDFMVCNGVPTWAIDMFTIAGKMCLSRFLRQPSETGRWIKQHIPATERGRFLQNIHFAAESGVLRNRYVWDTGSELRRMAECESQGAYCLDASEAIELMREDIDLLNRVRADVL